MSRMGTKDVHLPTKESVEALFTLVQNSVTVDKKVGMLRICIGNIEVDGWAMLAKALSLAPSGWVHHVDARVEVVKEGRRGDLKTVWDSLVHGWFVGDERFRKTNGERAWTDLEKLLDKN